MSEPIVVEHHGVEIWRAAPHQAAFIASKHDYPLLLAPLGSGRSSAVRWALLLAARDRRIDTALITTRKFERDEHERALLLAAANLGEATYDPIRKRFQWKASGGRVWLVLVEEPKDLTFYRSCRWHVAGCDGLDRLPEFAFDWVAQRAWPRESVSPHPRVYAAARSDYDVPAWVGDRWGLRPGTEAHEGYELHVRFLPAAHVEELTTS